MKRKVEALRRRVQEILVQSDDWYAWQSALDSALSFEKVADEGYRFIYCVDASEAVEYLAPASLLDEIKGDDAAIPRDEYPTPLDLSLLIIFRPERQVFILPSHFQELRSLGSRWVENARQDFQKLSLIKEALQAYEARLEDLRRDSSGGMDQFVQFVLREGRSFGLLFWRSSENGQSFDDLMHRLRIPDRELLSLKDEWTYQPDARTIDAYYQRLEESRVGRGSAASNRRDAHALHFLERINEAMPEDSLLILSTHSSKIWKIIEELRQSPKGEYALYKKQKKQGKEEAAEGRISLVQRPQVALIRKFLWEAEEGQERDELRRQLVLEKERNQSLSNVRVRLEHDILPHLQKRQTEKLDLGEVEHLVEDLEEGLKRLESVSRDRQRLERTRLALESSVGERGPLAHLREVIKGQRHDELKEILQEKLDAILQQMEGIQQRLSFVLSATPETSLSFEGFEEEEPSAGIRAILHSRPGGMAYTIHFESLVVDEHLRRIQELLRELDDARRLPNVTQRRQAEQGARLGLHREMYSCKVQLQKEPEYYLLLASVYNSRDMWFQAFDAADQGLKMLQESGDPEDAPPPKLEVASAWTELLLAKAIALTNWTLEGYADLPSVATTFLAQAASLTRRSLQLQRRWSGVLHHYLGLDPRCLRELGIIYGTARGAGIDLEVDPADCTLAEFPPDSRPDLLELFFAFSRAANQELNQTEENEIRAYYENSLLYALIERDREEELSERAALARALDSRAETQEQAKLLDTLAWHHFRLAQRYRKADRPYGDELKAANQYSDKADQKIDKNNRYYNSIHREHREQIKAFPPPGNRAAHRLVPHGH